MLKRTGHLDPGKMSELGRRIRSELRRIRSQIRMGDDSELVVWVIPDELACSQRPLRDHPKFGGRGRPLPREARPSVVKWGERVKQLGFHSIICLMHAKELRYYDGLGLDRYGLLGYYKKQGFYLRHLPWADPAHARTAEERLLLKQQGEVIKKKALAAFDDLPKPVLVHCSAGIDRTTPVAAFIADQKSTGQGPFV